MALYCPSLNALLLFLTVSDETIDGLSIGGDLGHESLGLDFPVDGRQAVETFFELGFDGWREVGEDGVSFDFFFGTRSR